MDDREGGKRKGREIKRRMRRRGGGVEKGKAERRE